MFFQAGLFRAAQEGYYHAKDGDKPSCLHDKMKAFHENIFMGRMILFQAQSVAQLIKDTVKNCSGDSYSQDQSQLPRRGSVHPRSIIAS